MLADGASLTATAASYSQKAGINVPEGASLTIYDSVSASGNQYLGITKGTLNVTEGCTVTVPHVRVLNSSDTGNSVTVNIDGTVVVTSTSTAGPEHTYDERGQYKGILLGHWKGQGTYNITGSLLATNAYLQTVFSAGTQTLNVNGGLLKVRGLYAREEYNNTTVSLSGNGTIEVSEIPDNGGKITKSFRWGTFRTVADVTETRAINFSAASGNATTLDPTSHKLTLAAGSVTGSGDIRVAASDNGGQVEFMSLEGYAGHITVSSGTAIYYLTDYEYAMGVDLTVFSVEVDGALTLLYGNGYAVPADRIRVTEVDGVCTYSVTPNPNTWTRVESSLLSDEMNWSHGNTPSDGDSFCIRVTDETEIVVDIDVAAHELIVEGPGTAKFVDDVGLSSMTATNLTVKEATVVADGTYFQPLNVAFEEDGSLTVGDYGLLTNAVITYSGTIPTTNEVAFTATGVGSVATDPERWRGTVCLKSISSFPNFESSPYGNAQSVVRLSAVTGWLRTPGNYRFVNTAPIELSDEAGTAFTVNNGNSADSTSGKDRKCSYFPALLGSGTLLCNGSAAKVVMVFGDGSGFSGKLKLENKMVVFGSDMPDVSKVASARIYVAEGMEVAVPASSAAWYGSNGILVDGQITLGKLDHIGGGTTITTSDDGVVVLTGYSGNNEVQNNVSFSRVAGTGTLRLVNSGQWSITKNAFPSTMILDNRLQGGLVMTYSGGTNVVGSLTGSCNLLSNYGQDDRVVKIVQSVDTTWSGAFVNSDRISDLLVSPSSDGRAGTLTLSGAQTHTNGLHVASGGSVKLTGKWIGDVTSDGSFGGTGEIVGDVAFCDGATLRVEDPSDLLFANGTLTVSGKVTVRFASEEDYNSSNGKNIVRALGGVLLSGAEFSVMVAGETLPSGRARILQVGDGLQLKGRSFKKQPFRVIIR